MMRKFFVGLLVGAVAVGLAAPAYAADLKFTGGYRVRFQFDKNLPCMTEETTDCTGHEFQARFAPRFDVETEGGVRGVIRLEIGDLRFGETATLGKGTTGGAANDSVNVETKWAYIDFPVPATPLRLRAGLQPVALSKELFFGEDFPGVSLYGKLGEINANAFWVRGNNKQSTVFGTPAVTGTITDANALVSAGVGAQGEDARDIYGLDLAFSPMKDLSLNVYLVYDHDMENVLTVAPIGESTTGVWFGVGGAGKVQNIRWDLDFVYGTKELPTGIDQKGWMVDGGVGMAVPGTAFDLEARGWWATGRETDVGDNDAFPVLIGPDHNAGGTNVWGAGQDSDIDALAANAQNTWGIGLIARYTVSPTLKVAGNVHYIGTVEEGTSTFASTAGDGKIAGVDSIGTEVAVKVDYTIAKGLVFTLTAGHLFLGDDTPIIPVGGITKFDDVTKVFGVVNYFF